MNRGLLAFAGLLVAGATVTGVYVALPGGGEEEAVQQVATSTPGADVVATPTQAAEPPAGSPTPATRTPGAGETLWRWGNISVILPDEPGVIAGPDFAAGGSAKVVPFVIQRTDPVDGRILSYVFIDAENGAVIDRKTDPSDDSTIDRILDSVSIGPLEKDAAPWPHQGEPTPELIRESPIRGISYLRPSPATGLYVGFGIGDPGGGFVDMRNERSVVFVSIDPTTGDLVVDKSGVLEEDLKAFDRWVSTVRRCDRESECD